MEIDDKLKNRLAGTAVVTVLAIIFLPMMFDDPVVKKSQVVTELDIPRKPEPSPLLATSIVPNKATDVTEGKAEMSGLDPTDAEAGTDTGRELIDNSEKTDPELDADKIPVDSEAAAAEEDITPAPVKKSTHKAAPEPEKTVAEVKPVAKAKPVKAKEIKEVKEVEKTVEDKKLAKAKVEKKPAKPELPVLDAKAQDKKPETATTEPGKATAHRWMIQVVSLNDKAKAEAFRDKLRAQGFPATVDSAWVKDKGRVYRLKVGPELDAQKAQATKNKINQLNKATSFVVSE